MSEEVRAQKPIEPTRAWISKFIDEWRSIESLAPVFHAPEDGQPEWVTRLDREIARALYGNFKAEELEEMTPKRLGSLLGRQLAIAEWAVNWLDAQIPCSGERGKTGTKEAFRSMVNMAILRTLAKRNLVSSKTNPAAVHEVMGPPYLVLDYHDFKEGIDEIEADGRLGKTQTQARNRILVIAVDAKDVDAVTVKLLDQSRLSEKNTQDAEQPDLVKIPYGIAWVDLNEAEKTSELPVSDAPSPSHEGPEPVRAMLAFPDLDLIEKVHREKLGEDVTAKKPQKISVPLVDAEDLEHVQEILKRVTQNWCPRIHRLAKKAVCSCLDREYEEVVGFAEGFASGFGRNPGKLGMQKPKAPPLELYIVLASMWQYVQGLDSVPHLHLVLTDALGPRRAGTLERLQKTCNRIGLHLPVSRKRIIFWN